MSKTSRSVTTLCGLAAAALVSWSTSAPAADAVPDIKGKWVGKTHTIIAGSGGHWPSSPGTFAKPALHEKDLQLDITDQNGRRFWGVTTLSSPTEKTSEPFIGELTGRGNTSFVVVDTDGYFNGQLTDNDTISFCYAQAGGLTQSSVVSCTEITRVR
jgi:hypothetical protein